MGKGKGKGKGKRKKPMSEAKLAKLKEKQEARAADEGREEAGNKFYTGELIKRSMKSGWIKPSNFGQLPADIKTKISEMVQQKRAVAEENGNTNLGTFNQKVIYVRMCDVAPQTKISVGDTVKFKLYTDTEGVGAHAVTTV